MYRITLTNTVLSGIQDSLLITLFAHYGLKLLKHRYLPEYLGDVSEDLARDFQDHKTAIEETVLNSYMGYLHQNKLIPCSMEFVGLSACRNCEHKCIAYEAANV